jgi:hypothetical protein
VPSKAKEKKIQFMSKAKDKCECANQAIGGPLACQICKKGELDMPRIEKHVCATCGNAECAASQETIGLDPWYHSCPSWQKDGPYIFHENEPCEDLGAPRTAQAILMRALQKGAKR